MFFKHVFFKKNMDIKNETIIVGGTKAWDFYAEQGVESAKEVIEERKGLIRILRELGFSFKVAQSAWPRNLFVCHNGRVYKRSQHGSYADGGMILNYSDFSFASSAVSSSSRLKDPSSQKEVLNKLKRLYGENIVILPTPFEASPVFGFELNSDDIDLYMLSVPERKRLYVDSIYYKEFQREIDESCEKFGLKKKLVEQNGLKSFPCNAQVFKNGNLFMIANSDSPKSFLDDVRDLGIELKTLPFSRNCQHNGSIRCATNSAPNQYVFDIEV